MAHENDILEMSQSQRNFHKKSFLPRISNNGQNESNSRRISLVNNLIPESEWTTEFKKKEENEESKDDNRQSIQEAMNSVETQQECGIENNPAQIMDLVED